MAKLMVPARVLVSPVRISLEPVSPVLVSLELVSPVPV